MVRKVAIGIFIAIFVIFLMSHNASAITPVIDLNNYEQYRYLIYPVNDCTFTGGENYFTGRDSFCRVTVRNFTTINSIKTHDTYAVKKGDIVNYYLFVYTSTNPVNFLPKLENISNNLLGWDLISFNAVAIQDYINSSTTTGNLYQYDSANLSLTDTENNFYSVYRIYELTMRANQDGNLYVGLNTGGGIFSMPIEDFGVDFVYSIKFLKWFRQGESQENKEVEEKTQGAVDQSTSDGNSSQTTVESSTQSLMSAGGSIISALINAPATDCNINVQTSGSSRLFTTAIGQLNLCSDVPQGVLNMVQGIVALVFTPIVLYFTYNVLTTLYNQFKEYNS